MLIKSAKYNKAKDIASVDQFGFVDVTKAFESGMVPSSIAPSDEQYNDIDNPDSILGKPSDIFEAYRMKEYVNSVGTSEGNSGGEAASGSDEN